MLRGVLLHVIDPALPVELAGHGAWWQLRGCVMDHFLPLFSTRCVRGSRSSLWSGVHDFQNLSVTKPAEVVRLAARRRVKRRAFENDSPTVSFALAGEDIRFKFPSE